MDIVYEGMVGLGLGIVLTVVIIACGLAVSLANAWLDNRSARKYS